LLDTESGELLWSRTDSSLTEPVYYNIEPVSVGGLMCVPTGRAVKALDLRDGSLRHLFAPLGSPMPQLSPLGKDFALQSSNDWGRRETCVYRYNAHDGGQQIVYTEHWPDSVNIFGRTPVALNDEELFFTAIYQNQHTRSTHSKWKILHLPTGKVLREGTAYPSNDQGYGPTKQPVLFKGDVILTAYDHLARICPSTGEERWRAVMPRDMLSSKPLIAGDALFCALEDGFLYRLNAENGQVAWKAKLSGTPSRLAACGGHIFAIGGGNGLLYTLEAETGKEIRKMKAPDHDYGKDAFFRRFIALAPTIGRLLVFDGRRLRGYSVFEGE
jgi:FOG: WD40-like repeat